jgi:Flp pilus assembly protein TadB
MGSDVQIVEGEDDDEKLVLVPEKSFMVLPFVAWFVVIVIVDDDDDPMLWTREPSRSDQAWRINTKRRNRIKITRTNIVINPTWTTEVLLFGLDRSSLLKSEEEVDVRLQLHLPLLVALLLFVFSFLFLLSVLSSLWMLLLLGTTTPVVVVRRLGKLELSLWLRSICREIDRVSDFIFSLAGVLPPEFGRMGLFHQNRCRYW